MWKEVLTQWAGSSRGWHRFWINVSRMQRVEGKDFNMSFLTVLYTNGLLFNVCLCKLLPTSSTGFIEPSSGTIHIATRVAALFAQEGGNMLPHTPVVRSYWDPTYELGSARGLADGVLAIQYYPLSSTGGSNVATFWLNPVTHLTADRSVSVNGLNDLAI